MKSMTGYGRAEYKQNGITLIVELKTVNNRFLDLSSKYPRSFMPFDDVIRNTVSSQIKRGKTDLYITYKDENLSSQSLEVDVSLAKAYLDASNKIAEATGLTSDVTVTTLLKSPDVVSDKKDGLSEETVVPILTETLKNALTNLDKMRLFEGEKLKNDLLNRMNVIESLVSAISLRAPLVKEDYRVKLTERVKEALSGTEIDESRLLQEVAIYTDKSNIDEELTRLKSHISQFRKICEVGGEVGKKLDFLVQEFNREANTVCSKSNDITVTDNALKLKCEIEKVREQIQNLE